MSLADLRGGSMEASMRPEAFEDPFVAPLLRDPHSAMIFEDIDCVDTNSAYVSRLLDIESKGFVRDQMNNKADYGEAPVFFIFRGELTRSGAIGFAGCDNGREDLEPPRKALQLATRLFGGSADGKEKLVCFGAPDKNKSGIIREKIFKPMLKNAADKAGFGAIIELDSSADAEISKIITCAKAWTGLNKAAEMIVRTSMMSGAADICRIKFVDGKFVACEYFDESIDVKTKRGRQFHAQSGVPINV